MDKVCPVDPTIVRGWDACRAALSDPRLVSDPYLAGLLPAPTNNFLLMDGDNHRAIRRLLTGYLSAARVDTVRDRLQRTCDASVATLVAGGGGADLMTGVVEPLVLEAIFSIMEVAAHHRPALAAHARLMRGLLDPELAPEARRRTTTAALPATMIFERDGRARRATGLHAALEAAAADGLIPVKLARATPVVVLHGGYENPLNQLGCIVAWAVADPQRFRAAALASPSTLFEEVLRRFTPARRLARWTSEVMARDARVHPRGDLVWVDLESANVEDRETGSPAPDLGHRHLGFGYGRHACPGAGLARLQGQVLIRSLLAVPAEVVGACTVEWHEDLITRGPARIVSPSDAFPAAPGD